MTSFKNTIYVALFFAITMGIFNAIYFDIQYALLSFPISFLVFGIPIYFFSRQKSAVIPAEIDTEGQEILYSSPANHFYNGEGVGGKLYLMDDKIQFQSYLNIQSYGHVLRMDQISSVKSHKMLGVFSKGLSITTINGETQKYVVNNRKLWKVEIERLINQ